MHKAQIVQLRTRCAYKHGSRRLAALQHVMYAAEKDLHSELGGLLPNHL